MNSPVATPAAGIAPTSSTAAPAPRAIIDYDFQSVLAAPPRQRLVLWLLAGLLAALAIGLAITKVDMVVAANGKIITTDSQIVVQPIETSVVRSVAVKVGDRVKTGDVLATLDPTFSEADAAELSAKLRNLNAAYARLEAELAGVEYDPKAPNAEQLTQRDIFRKRHEEYAAKLASSIKKAEQYKADLVSHQVAAEGLAAQVKLIGEQQRMYEGLVAQNLASKVKLLDTSQRLLEAKGRLDTNLGGQQELAAQIAGALAERDAFVHEWQRKLSEEMAQTRSERDARRSAVIKGAATARTVGIARAR
jgi:hemolysin D